MVALHPAAIVRSFFPYGFTRFGDDRDMLADAEAGRLVLDNSRNADGTYRRDNKGYFAEIAQFAGDGLGAWGSSLWTSAPTPYVMPAVTVGPEYDPYAFTGRTRPVVGPTEPLPSRPPSSGDSPAVVSSGRQTSGSAGIPGWAIGLGVGALGLGVVFLAVSHKRGQRTRRRR